MEGLLVSDDARYHLDAGVKIYIAFDNMHGGYTAPGVVTGKALLDGRDAYRIEFYTPGSFVREEAVVYVDRVFVTLVDVARVRKSDDSVELNTIREVCSTNQGLIAFLLSRANVTVREYKVVEEVLKESGVIS